MMPPSFLFKAGGNFCSELSLLEMTSKSLVQRPPRDGPGWPPPRTLHPWPSWLCLPAEAPPGCSIPTQMHRVSERRTGTLSSAPPLPRMQPEGLVRVSLWVS